MGNQEQELLKHAKRIARRMEKKLYYTVESSIVDIDISDPNKSLLFKYVRIELRKLLDKRIK